MDEGVRDRKDDTPALATHTPFADLKSLFKNSQTAQKPLDTDKP